MLTATVCVALSGAGLATAVLTAWRRRFRAATRTAAVAALPVGLYLAGLVTLGRRIGTAVGDWAADLVLDPKVWTGFAVLGCAVLLYLASRLGRSRRAGRAAADAGAAPVAPGGGAAAVPPPGGRPAVTAGNRAPERAGKPGKAAKAGKGAGAGEFDEIEEILRKRGI